LRRGDTAKARHGDTATRRRGDARGVLFCAALAIAFGQISDYQQGVSLIDKGQFADAVPLLTRATQSRPRDAQAWKALGVAYAAQQLYSDAEPVFRRACELNPQLSDACYYHGRALYALDRYEASLRALELAQRADATSWKVHLGVAQALEALGRPDEAEKKFRQALSLCRNSDPQPGIAYAHFLLRQGRVTDAIVALEEILKRFPTSAEANTHFGRALLEQGNVAGAIQRLERAVAADPASAQAHLLLAKAYVRVGRTAEAQPHFDAAASYEAAAQGAR
jgi:Flp pilus assembly protein TadD